MKKITITVILVLSALILRAQGIHFENGLTWEQVKQKAQSENKYIFLDCYATWCGPCKIMDSVVYTNNNVGDFINSHFICVKVQIDSSKNDGKTIQMWYKDAKIIRNGYRVIALPTFLFFTSDGDVRHRYSGATDTTSFIKIAQHALDTNHQYYTRIKKFKHGLLKDSDICILAKAARNNGDKKMADSIARCYVHQYLNKKVIDYDKTEIDFLIDFQTILTSKDGIFTYIFKHSNKIDFIAKFPGLSNKLINFVITSEEINRRLWPANRAIPSKPDWNFLTKVIKSKYNSEHAAMVVFDAQNRWYTEKKDWSNLFKYYALKTAKYGLDTAGLGFLIINNFCYSTVLKHSNNKKDLQTASKWMSVIVNNHPDACEELDTYANLLYKIGRTQKALFWERKAFIIEQKNALKQKRSPDSVYRNTIYKMQKGKPTWL